MCIKTATLVLLAMTMVPSSGLAQTNDPVPATVNVTFPAEQPHPDQGKVALYKGEADKVGVVFAIPASTVFANSAIVLETADGKQVQLGLRNDLTSGWDRTATTDANGYAEFRYRTEGTASLLIQSVTPGERVSFQVAFYQGKEMPVHRTLPPPFTKAGGAAAVTSTTTSTTGAMSSSPVLWVIAGLLGLLVVVGGLMLMRMQKSTKESK